MMHQLKQLLRFGLIFLGILLIVNGISMSIVSNFSTGIVLLWLLGGMLASTGLWWDALQMYTKRGVLRVIKYIVLLGILSALGLCIFLSVYGQTDTADNTEDVILVLGCGVKGTTPTAALVERLETALQAHRTNPDAYILVSGGQGPQEACSEAEVMERYLLRYGVEAEKILKEDRSTSTSENYKYSKELLDAHFSDYTLVVITNTFHIYRAKCLARLAKLDVHTLHADTPLSGAAMMYAREVLAVCKLWLFGY